MSNIFARKSMAVLKAEAEETEAQALVTHGGVPLKRTLSAWSLISLGIGCIQRTVPGETEFIPLPET